MRTGGEKEKRLMKEDRLVEVLTAYGEALDGRRYSVGREKGLPHPKKLIQQAIVQELIDPSFPEMEGALAEGYVELASFIGDKEFELVSSFERSVLTGKERPATEPETPREVHVIYQRIRKAREERAKEVEGLRLKRKDQARATGGPGQ